MTTLPSPASPSPPLPLHRARALVELLCHAHGVPVDGPALDGAERRALARGRPMTFSEAIGALAADAGLTVSPVRRGMAEVLQDADRSMPWIALRRGGTGEDDGVVVLEGVRGGARVAEPGGHTARWSTASLQHWLGVAGHHDPADWLLAEPAAPLTAMRTPADHHRLSPFTRLRALLVAERRTLWVAIVYSAVIGLLSLVVPVAVQLLVNTIAFGSLLQPLAVLMIAVFVALGFSTVLNALRAAVVEIIQRSIFARVATDVTWRLLRVRVDAFDRFHGPELVNRFFDTVTVQKSAALLLIDGLSILMQTAIGMVLLAVYHPFLLAFDVFLVAAMLVIVFLLGRSAVGTAISESKAKYALEAWLEQIAAHLVTFKSAGATSFATEQSRQLLEDYLGYRSKHFRILIRQVIGSFALQAVASSTLLGIGGWLVINRQLTLGQLVASEIVVTLMMSAFTKFGKQLEVFYDLCAAVDKLGDLIDLPLERQGGEAVLPGRGPVPVALTDVAVRYEDGLKPAMSVAHWSVEAGERVGLTGSNGSGKSTLCDVLFGLRSTTSGVVRIGGVDLRAMPLATVRHAVALVRGVELFPGTVLDNVRLGRPDVSLDDVTRALAAVGLLDELEQLPLGLHTKLSAHGRPLSHRQACRLMIARAIVARPRLLVLDGALDSIDQPSDRERLHAAVFAPDAPWTLVCVSDRPDVLARCTRVVAVRDGALHEVTR